MPEPELTLDEAYERYVGKKMMRQDLFRLMIDEIKRIDGVVSDLHRMVVMPTPMMMPLPPLTVPASQVQMVPMAQSADPQQVTWSEINDPTRWAAAGVDHDVLPNGQHVRPGPGRKPRGPNKPKQH